MPFGRRIILMAAVLVLALQNACAQDAPQTPDTTFRVDVKLVNVFVTVTDQHGTPIADLSRERFKVFEDGVPQELRVFNRESELPLSIALAIDSSGSTHKDLRFELESARHFARSILRPVDKLSLYQFADVVEELTPFTNDLGRIEGGIRRVRSGAGTAMYDAIFLASEKLQGRDGRKVLVLITDGGDTMSTVDYQGAVRAAQQSEAILYSIIVVPVEASAGRNTGGEHALIQLSHDTGGKYYFASSQSQLDAAFREIGDELRTQYLLAYYPKQRLSSSDFRRIEVQVSPQPGDGTSRVSQSRQGEEPVERSQSAMLVRHRSGYYTSRAK